MTGRGYVRANDGTGREQTRTDYIAPGYIDPDTAHDTWIDPESLIPQDWEPTE